jgi:hypothetical protein
MPNGRCRIHGGKSLSGVESPQFKHGRYSKAFDAAIPPRMRQQYEEAMHDEELLSHRRFIALCDVDATEKLKRFSECDAGAYRKKMQSLWKDFKSLQSDKEMDPEARKTRLSAVLGELEKLIALGADEADAWEEFLAAAKERASYVNLEHRRMIDMQLMMTPEQAAHLVLMLHQVIQEKVNDACLRQEIGMALLRATGLGPPLAKDIRRSKEAAARLRIGGEGSATAQLPGEVVDVESMSK